MAFADLLERVGSTGRFQVVHTTLLCLPVLMMASHNLLQNFVASVPPHFCRAHGNLSSSASTPLSAADALRITVPLDANTGAPEKCRRYDAPQWHLLADNGSAGAEAEETGGWDSEDAKGTEGPEPQRGPPLQDCVDGWTYDETERSSSIISEVR